MFNAYPASRRLFSRVNGDNVSSIEFLAHSGRVATALDIIFNALRSPRVLDHITYHLAMQHSKRPGVTAELFEVDYSNYAQQR